MRFGEGPDSFTARVRWFFTSKKPIDTPTPYCSSNWRTWKDDDDDGPGEVRAAGVPWRDGSPPEEGGCVKPFGDPEAWKGGLPPGYPRKHKPPYRPARKRIGVQIKLIAAHGDKHKGTKADKVFLWALQGDGHLPPLPGMLFVWTPVGDGSEPFHGASPAMITTHGDGSLPQYGVLVGLETPHGDGSAPTPAVLVSLETPIGDGSLSDPSARVELFDTGTGWEAGRGFGVKVKLTQSGSDWFAARGHGVKVKLTAAIT